MTEKVLLYYYDDDAGYGEDYDEYSPDEDEYENEEYPAEDYSYDDEDEDDEYSLWGDNEEQEEHHEYVPRFYYGANVSDEEKRRLVRSLPRGKKTRGRGRGRFAAYVHAVQPYEKGALSPFTNNLPTNAALRHFLFDFAPSPSPYRSYRGTLCRRQKLLRAYAKICACPQESLHKTFLRHTPPPTDECNKRFGNLHVFRQKH